MVEISKIFKLQKKLNDNTNGKNWKLGINKYNKRINWLRCIHLEAAEAIESTPYKHWKSITGSTDWDNIRVEIIDILHFLFSELIIHKDKINLEEMQKDFNNMKTMKIKDEDRDWELINEKFELIINYSTNNQLDNQKKAEYIYKTFLECCELSGLSDEDILKLYIGKNVLNQFRQDNGYKEGTYQKVLNGKEDNVYMQEIIESLSIKELDFDNLYSKIEDNYNKLLKK